MPERDYIKGSRAAYADVLAICLRNLDPKTQTEHGWRVERARAVAALRSLCSDYGDNDWGDGLDLGDVVEKHVHRHLTARLRNQR